MAKKKVNIPEVLKYSEAVRNVCLGLMPKASRSEVSLETLIATTAQYCFLYRIVESDETELVRQALFRLVKEGHLKEIVDE